MRIAYFCVSLLAGLVIVIGMANAIEKFYPTGRQIEVAAATVAPLAVIKVAAIAPATTDIEKPDVWLAKADADAGRDAVKVCAVCHTWTKGGPNKIGPNLYGVVGREVAKDPGFAYSGALQHKGGKWSFNDLFAWIDSPNELVPGNNMYKMGFAGIKDPQARANVIAFLARQSDSPAPLPR